MAPPPADADPVKTAGFAVIVSKSPTLGREVLAQVVLMVQDLPKAARRTSSRPASASGAA